MTQCLFCKIVSGEIPSRKVFENDELLVFHDINPAAPVHLLVIPKHHVTSMQDITEADAGWLGRMMSLIPKIAAENGCRPGPDGGFRVVANSGADGGQEVAHLHFHILGGPRPGTSASLRRRKRAKATTAPKSPGGDGGPTAACGKRVTRPSRNPQRPDGPPSHRQTQ
ncbi:histidine triad nucleotide-binding protein [Neopusillimonas aromaticivorans]|nr:histidine triad nucleotide-binding protein [Neopusillimonas aromaticivorans]WJJ94669.1 histidine triad nucleotide-binding protein [Neopusillimonas aromaticivorans]